MKLQSILLLLLMAACSKDDSPETPAPAPQPENGILFTLKHVSGTSVLEFDTIKYQNAAGNPYSVSRLQYYLSGFEFTTTTGSKWTSDAICYVDAASGKTLEMPLPFGDYASVRFYIGLDSAHNISNSLPNTIENVNMIWPDMMGGGYHFMKLEGSFLNNGQSYGYAMHIGKTVNLVTVNINQPFSTQAASRQFNLVMDINEWYANPYAYDFNTDGNYTMTDDTAMAKLKANGADVFSIEVP